MLIANLKNVEVVNIASERLHLHRHSKVFHLSYDDKVIAIGQYFNGPFNLMAAHRTFSHECCNSDCLQMLKANCNISKCCTGVPLINSHGEVIGINCYDDRHTPFISMNIALKCLENFEKNGKFARHYCFGMKGANLYAAASLHKLKKIIQKLFNISKGILVKVVVQVSPNDHVGIRAGDVLVQCDGCIIYNILEFETMLLDKVGN
ncbi:hypothetical protein FRX31_014531 [Thalictrum thalictroides]|uniref:PDZ domain-containing protein n=1 Tax=Thalictrum thalictroides TaxID=46969 RepID=A0A7J6WET2_THATH|nr:hypothetical protein FRX31_014531 [Thalictrum thalictroides]